MTRKESIRRSARQRHGSSPSPCRQGGASLTDAKAVTGQAGLEPMGESDQYSVAEHLKDRFGAAQLGQSTSDQAMGGSERVASDQPDSPDTDSVIPVLTNLTDDQRKIMALCEVPRKQAYLMQETGLSHRTFFRRKRSEPLIQAKLIRMTRPDEPDHPDQAYVITEAGLRILDPWRTGAGREQDSRAGVNGVEVCHSAPATHRGSLVTLPADWVTVRIATGDGYG